MKQLKLKLEDNKKTIKKEEEALLHFTNGKGKKRAVRVSFINSFIESDDGGCVMTTDSGFTHYAKEKYTDIISLIEKL